MMFSYVFSIVLITTIAVFHSSHAATSIFTIGDQSPSISGAFLGTPLMRTTDVPNKDVNGLYKMVTLNQQFPLKYFGTKFGKIFVSV